MVDLYHWICPRQPRQQQQHASAQLSAHNQNQVFHFLYTIWPKSRDLYATYLKATKPPSVWDIHLVANKTLKAVTWFARLA